MNLRNILAAAFLAVSFIACTSAPPQRHLLIVVDGLRPDYVTADVMPNLTALGKRGVVFNRHHSVYPTVTRVNASSISTGAYPDRRTACWETRCSFRRVDPTRFLDTSDRNNLLKVARRRGPPADRHHARRITSGGRPEDARRQLGVDRFGLLEQSHGVGRGDPALPIHAAAGSSPQT